MGAKDKGYRFILNQGGRGSSKTYSIAQLFLILLYSEQNLLLTVCRKTLPALKATAMRDFILILHEKKLYRETCHNKTELTYKYGTNEIEFISIDEPQKIRGRKRQYLWLNEANEFSLEDFRQLNMRTEKQIFMDFNPSDEYHWIYDEVMTRDDSLLIKSTYKDNPFLDKAIVKEIERFRHLDKNYWRIYGLGERAVSENKIYTHWQYCDDLPSNRDETIFGLDFGFNNPSALVEIAIKDECFYVKERLYDAGLTNAELINKMKAMGIGTDQLYADCAEPARIEEFRQADFNIDESDKSVKDGIDFLKSHELYICKDSTNLLKEIKSYAWKMKDDKRIDEPVKVLDHLMDAMRYAAYTHNKNPEPNIVVF